MSPDGLLIVMLQSWIRSMPLLRAAQVATISFALRGGEDYLEHSTAAFLESLRDLDLGLWCQERVATQLPPVHVFRIDLTIANVVRFAWRELGRSCRLVRRPDRQGCDPLLRRIRFRRHRPVELSSLERGSSSPRRPTVCVRAREDARSAIF